MQKGDLERKTHVTYRVMVNDDTCAYGGDDKGLAIGTATAERRNGNAAYVVKIKTTYVIADPDISGALYTVRNITKDGIQSLDGVGWTNDFDRMAGLYRDIIVAGGLPEMRVSRSGKKDSVALRNVARSGDEEVELTRKLKENAVGALMAEMRVDNVKYALRVNLPEEFSCSRYDWHDPRLPDGAIRDVGELTDEV